MKVDSDLRKRIAGAFRLVADRPAGDFPAIATLSDKLSDACIKRPAATELYVPRTDAALLTTASVDMWMRSVHSYLLSCSLTSTSPLWSSVAGYYSSHYSIRAFAHLLGHFQLYKAKRVLCFDPATAAARCRVVPKRGQDREHRYYWRAVKESPQFASDALFTDNTESGGLGDASHRERGQYADHLNLPSTFRALNMDELRLRADRISKIVFSTPPIPAPQKFADLESVQIIAYHRLVRYRQVVDECIEGKNRFWSVLRKPSWAAGTIDFQLADQGGLGDAAA